jgi:hypothetical protein
VNGGPRKGLSGIRAEENGDIARHRFQKIQLKSINQCDPTDQE